MATEQLCQSKLVLRVKEAVYDITVSLPVVVRERQLPVLLNVLLAEPYVHGQFSMETTQREFPLTVQYEVTGGSPLGSSAEIADPALVVEFPGLTAQVQVQQRPIGPVAGRWLTNNPIIGVDDKEYEVRVSVPEQFKDQAVVLLEAGIAPGVEARVIHENNDAFKMSGAVVKRPGQNEPVSFTAVATDAAIPVNVVVLPRR